MWKAWGEFLDEPEPYDFSVRVEDDGTGKLWIEPTKPVPSVLALELGELLYQLRAGLDAAIYQAAICDTGQDPPPDDNALEFPICRTVKGFERSARKIAPLTNRKLLAFIHKVQPCHISELKAEGAEWVPQTLELLNDWARKDRHRALHVVGSWPAAGEPLFDLPTGVKVVDVELTGIGKMLEGHQELARFVLSGWERDMKMSANPNTFIEIASSEDPPPRSPADTFEMRVKQLFAVVELVLKAFEQGYRRILPVSEQVKWSRRIED